MKNLTNWAYGFKLNHEGAGVGTIYYSQKYFDKEQIVNPATAEPYSLEEINTIKNGAVDGASDYTSSVPENVILGMNVLNSDKVFWYDEENANKILASADPLLLDKENGNMKTTSGEVTAKSM